MKDLIQFNEQLENEIPELKPTQIGFSKAFSRLVFGTRINKGWTQAELAAKANIGVKTVHRIEGGSGGITDNTYEKVFAVLDLTDDIVGDYLKKKYEDSKVPVFG